MKDFQGYIHTVVGGMKDVFGTKIVKKIKMKTFSKYFTEKS